MSTLLQISAGTGPVEVRRFVALLAPRMVETAREAGLVVEGVVSHGPDEAPGSIGLLFAGDDPLPGWHGTHCWVDPSRGRGQRRRWFAGVTAVTWPATEAPPVDPSAVRITACRAGGPGGQHVNTSATAVRVVHGPTGIAVRADSERSQAANRRAALRRLAEALAQRTARARTAARDRAWRAHHRLERGRPVMTWRGVPLRRV